MRVRITRLEGCPIRRSSAYGSFDIGPKEGTSELMYEYVCEHVIPGCTTTELAESRKAALEKAMIHLQKRHDIEHPDVGTLNAVNAAIVGVRT